MAKFFYARVSSTDQNLDRQFEAEKSVRADKVFYEKVSGKDNNREQLQTMIDYLRAGDIVVVKSLDRLSRNLKAFLETWDEIKAKGAILQVMEPAMTLDESDAMSTFIVQILMAAAQLERSMIRTRQMEGIKLAKERGAFTGRRPDKVKHEKIFRMYATGAMSKRDIAEAVGMAYSSICRILAPLDAQNKAPNVFED